ncbi:MAG: hypothetical protein QW687_00885 [Candidatus Hadarchaeales archaeon]
MIYMKIVLSLIASLLIGIAIFGLARNVNLLRFSPEQRRLMEFVGEEKREEEESVAFPYSLSPIAFPTAAICTLVVSALAFFFIPPLIALAIGLLAGYFVLDYFQRKRAKTLEELQKTLPLFLLRVSENLKVQPNPELALAEALALLSPGNVLRTYMVRLLEARKRHGHGVLLEAAKKIEKFSSDLALTLTALYHLWLVGGPGFPEAFSHFAGAIAQTLEIKRQAGAKGAGARRAVTIVAGSLLVVFTGLIFTPALGAVIRRPIVQVIYAIFLGMMGLGWKTMNDMVEEAMK